MVKAVIKKTAKKTTVTQAKESGMSVPMYSVSGEAQKEVNIPKDQLVGVSEKLLAQAVRVYRANLRQGTHAAKTRGEVTGSTRKIYRQKGTGKARHGAITAPIFVGGGIVHGPKPRDYRLSLPQKMQKRVFSAMILDRINTNHMKIISGLGDATGKTKDMVAMFKKLDLANKKLLLIIDGKFTKAVQGARNIAEVTIKPAISVSVLDMIQHQDVLIAQEALEIVLKRTKQSEDKAV